MGRQEKRKRARSEQKESPRKKTTQSEIIVGSTEKENKNEEDASNPDTPILEMNDSRVPEQFRIFFKKGLNTRLEKPTLVQSKCWPAIISGKDVFSIAPTGSGKTLAYVLPAVHHILKLRPRSRCVSVLALVPTRELACQVETVCRRLPKLFDICTLAVYGGKDRQAQVDKLIEKVDFVVGTPGRTLDLVESEDLSLSQASMLILDEADRMLDMGFEEDVQKILKHITMDHQTILLSATLKKKVETAILEMNVFREDNFVRIICEKQEANSEDTTLGSINKRVQQVVHVCAEHKKPRKLMKFIRKVRAEDKAAGKRNPSAILVFCTKIKTVNFLHKFLVKENVKASCLHGNMSQDQREKALKYFKAGKSNVLVATDVASRGLHISGLPYVLNYTFPPSMELYVHRIGRTGRANEPGHAYSFFTKNFTPLAKPLVKLLKECGQKIDPNLLSLSSENTNKSKE